MKRLIIALSLFILPSYAIELHNTVVLEHSSKISGGDDDGYAIDGHLDDVNSKSRIKIKSVKKHL